MGLEVQGVSKAFGGNRVLEDVTFSLGEAESACLIGPNGAGKTTAFNVVTGFVRPDSGAVTVDGVTLRRVRPHEVVRRGIIRSFQNTRVFDGLSCVDNVALACQRQRGEKWLPALATWPLLRAERGAVTARAIEALRLVGMESRSRELVDDLAQPQRKLINLAQLLASDARYVLLDEPAAGMDSRSVSQMAQVIRRIVEAGRSVLVVEHNMQFVRQLGFRVLFLHQGRLVADGDFETVSSNPELGRLYFGGGYGADG